MTAKPAPAPPETSAPEKRRHRYKGENPVHSNAPLPIRGRCSCGWRSEPVINGEFAHQQWEQHLADTEHPADATREVPRSASIARR